jgi:hypothetical protein
VIVNLSLATLAKSFFSVDNIQRLEGTKAKKRKKKRKEVKN